MSFLTAEWRKLAIVNYAIEPEVLRKYIPYKTELDLWNNTCYISLVGFMFQNTKLLGMQIPMHTHFEEVNLRFYVRYKDKQEWKRGVVFIKELVPKPALTLVANTVYKEHYQTVPMSNSWIHRKEQLSVEYSWKYNKLPQRIKVVASNIPQDIPIGSETEFITEHYWGYTRIKEDKTFAYEVSHPRWQAYEIHDHQVEVDFNLVYGKDFQFMNKLHPVSVMLAEGSPITVARKREL